MADEESIEGAVKGLQRRLMQSAAEDLDLAFARYDASQQEAALAHARRLIESEDPAERELGERLRAEVLEVTAAAEPPARLGIADGSGLHSGPPSAALPAPAGSSSTPGEGAEAPPKRGPGRPRKDPLPGDPPRRGPGRPPKHDRG